MQQTAIYLKLIIFRCIKIFIVILSYIKISFVNRTNFVHKFSEYVSCFSLHVSGNYVPNIRRKIPYPCDTWYLSLYTDDCLVCKAQFIPPWTPDSHLYTVTNTRCRIGTVFSPDDGHIVPRNMQKKAINTLRKFVHKLGSIYKRLYKDAQSKKHKIKNLIDDMNQIILGGIYITGRCPKKKMKTAHLSESKQICPPIGLSWQDSGVFQVRRGLPSVICLLRGLSPRANYTDRAAAAGRRSQCQLLRIEGCHVVSATDPHGR